MNKLLLLISALVFVMNPAYSQTVPGKIEGIVVDKKSNEPLPFSSVTILKKINDRDSLLAGVQTDFNGKFVISVFPEPELLLRISFVGYKNFEQKIQWDHLSGIISLQPDATLLDEVQVVGEKADVEISPGKRIFNVSKNMTSIGGTAESLLRNVPSITVDESGAATLRNMPTTIYVDGKPTQLTLAQIPANQIATVEVIANPSAKYDASTSGGIVNLVLKKNRLEGYHGMLSVGVGTNSRYDGTVSVDWKKRKWNITGLYSVNATRNPLNGYAHRENSNEQGIVTDYYDQHTDISLNNTFQSGRLAADYQVNSTNSISLAATLVGGAFNTISDQQYSYRNAAREVISYGSRKTVPHNDYVNSGVEFSWKHQFPRKDQELHLLTSITHNRVSNAGDWTTNSLTIENGQSQAEDGYPLDNRIDGHTSGNQYLAQLDYTHPISESVKWEFGIRSFTFVRAQQYFFNELHAGEAVLQLDYSQDARITESVNAAYAIYDNQLTKKFSLQAGLRFEQSSLHGKSRFDGGTFGYNYPSSNGDHIFQSLFPSLAFTKIVSESFDWNVALGRKVERPGFRQLFAGIQANDRQNITIGNPGLQPEFVNTAELNLIKTWTQQSGSSLQWLGNFYYIYEDHTIKPFTTPSEIDSTILVTTFTNAKADIQYGIDNTLTYSAGPISIVGNFNLYEVVLQTSSISNGLLAYNAKLNVSYKFGAGISTQISAQRRSKRPSLQGYQQAINGIDIAVRKSLFKNKGSLILSVNDVFNSRKQISIFDQPGIMQTTMNRRDIRYVKLTLQLPLGSRSNGKDRKLDQPDIDFGN